MAGISDIGDEQHIAVKKAICPGCLYGLPETREERRTRGMFVHRLPETGFEMECRANSYREARVNAREQAGPLS